MQNTELVTHIRFSSCDVCSSGTSFTSPCLRCSVLFCAVLKRTRKYFPAVYIFYDVHLYETGESEERVIQKAALFLPICPARQLFHWGNTMCSIFQTFI